MSMMSEWSMDNSNEGPRNIREEMNDQALEKARRRVERSQLRIEKYEEVIGQTYNKVNDYAWCKCGAGFKVKDYMQKYCSGECAYAAKKSRQAAKKI